MATIGAWGARYKNFGAISVYVQIISLLEFSYFQSDGPTKVLS